LNQRKETNSKNNTKEPEETKSKSTRYSKPSRTTEDNDKPIVRRKMRR
jgi:hypothetical protein